MFERLFRRRKVNSVKSASDAAPRNKSLVTSQATNQQLGKNNEQGQEPKQAIPSPSSASPTSPTTPHSSEMLPVADPEGSKSRTNGEYYDQLLYPNGARHPLPTHLADRTAKSTIHRPPDPKNTDTLRGMPLPKRAPVSASTSGVGPRLTLLSEDSGSSPPTTISSQFVGMMAPRPAPQGKKKELNKPKSLNLTSSAFRTLTKAIKQDAPSSSSTNNWASKPSPSTSIASTVSSDPKGIGRSPPVSAPEFGSKWRSEYFKDLIPQLVVPQTSVPGKSSEGNKRGQRQAAAASRYRDRKKRLIPSGLRSMPDNPPSGLTPTSAAMHISPPIMSNMLAEGPIPSSFVASGNGTSIASPRSAYYQSVPSASSVASNRSAASKSSKMRSTELVVKKNTRFDVPVSSGKSLLFS